MIGGVTQIKFIKHHLWVAKIYLRSAINAPNSLILYHYSKMSTIAGIKIN